MISTVFIFYTSFSGPLELVDWDQYCSQLESWELENINRFKHWQDRCKSLLGKLLLRQALSVFKAPQNIINKIIFTKYGKPYLPGINFNKTYSGNLVVCAISNSCRLGIDVELVRPVELSDFTNVMSQDQLENIRNSDNPYQDFFRLWTVKESAMKADGRGVSVPEVDLLETDFKRIHLHPHTWYLKEMDFAPGYSACLATDKQEFSIEIKEIKF